MAPMQSPSATGGTVDTVEISLMQRFTQLALSEGLVKTTKDYRDRQDDFISNEFDIYFGEETKLANWQKLCTDCHILNPPASITKCEGILFVSSPLPSLSPAT